MAKADPWEAAKPRLNAAVAGLHRKDEASRDAKDRSREGGDVATISLEDIKPRPHGDSRPLDEAHVASLVESCALLGLLQPIAVDRRQRLVCGGHRLAALHRLRIQVPEAYAKHFPDGLVPVRVLAFDAQQDPASARASELEENEQRKGYTRDQVIAFAAKLKTDGYRFTVGRPKEGEIALAPTLSLATGISLRTVRRYLAEGGGPSSESKSAMQDDPEHRFSHAAKLLMNEIRRFRDVVGSARQEQIRVTIEQCEKLEDYLQQALKKEFVSKKSKGKTSRMASTPAAK